MTKSLFTLSLVFLSLILNLLSVNPALSAALAKSGPEEKLKIEKPALDEAIPLEQNRPKQNSSLNQALDTSLQENLNAEAGLSQPKEAVATSEEKTADLAALPESAPEKEKPCAPQAKPDPKQLDLQKIAQELSHILHLAVKVEAKEALGQDLGLILKSASGHKILALLTNQHYLLGDLYTRQGHNLSQALAQKYTASTVLETFSEAILNLSEKLKKVAAPKEYRVSQESFNQLLKETWRYDLKGQQTKEEPSLLLVSAPSCPFCATLEGQLTRDLANHPLLLQVIPVLFKPNDAELYCAQKRKTAKDEHLDCMELTKELSHNQRALQATLFPPPRPLEAPFCVSKLADGTILAGSLTYKEILSRLSILSHKMPQTQKTNAP